MKNNHPFRLAKELSTEVLGDGFFKARNIFELEENALSLMTDHPEAAPDLALAALAHAVVLVPGIDPTTRNTLGDLAEGLARRLGETLSQN